jgi:cytochrome c-type biogenesis protein CcmH/NrfG
LLLLPEILNIPGERFFAPTDVGDPMLTLFFIIGVLLLICIGIIFYATRNKRIIIISSLILIILSLSLYHYLGNSQGVKNSILLQAFNNNQQEVLPELLQGLQKQLKQHPDDPITLVLLGKIYFTLGDYPQASKTFAQAYALLPDDLDLLIDYVTADYLAKDGKFDPQLTALWETLLEQMPKDSELYQELTLIYETAHKQ